jgi:Transposase DDE domain
MNEYEEDQEYSQAVEEKLEEFVGPLLRELDEQIDKRLVRTFLQTLIAIVTFRHSLYGLLLSELGGYILTPRQAPAGTKRLSNLLRSEKWSAKLIERFLWQQAEARVKEGKANGEPMLVGWDESVAEKPESLKAEGLCPVRSSQAARLKRIKPEFYNPPGGRPVFVPGLQWISLLVLGQGDVPPVVAAMRWWTTRGKYASTKRHEEGHLLRRCARRWGQLVLHIWDRGFASRRWLALALELKIRFVVRWPKRYVLVNPQGKEQNAWKVTRGKRSLDHRQIWDARRRCWRKTGILFSPVKHPRLDDPLWLVVARPGKGREPWYLLTNQPVASVDDAWRIVFAYARRWQVEVTYRYCKTELAMESPRLWRWHNRLKLLFIVTLVYAFLLSLLRLPQTLRDWLLRNWCHRTGKRYRHFAVPLYRLRSALSRLWTYRPPLPIFAWENSG